MTSSGLSKEAAFVLAAANRSVGAEVLCSLASDGLDWARVLEISVSEGAQPGLARRLRGCDELRLPAGVGAALDRIARITELRMEYVRQRLNEVAGEFARAGIPVVLLKGAALAQWAYESFGERYMSDLDLLVRPADAARAHELLQSAGWKLRFKVQYEWIYRDMHHLMPLVDTRAPAMKLNAEIHTSLIPAERDPFLLDVEAIWRDARRVEELPGEVFVPSPTHALWHTCVHYAWSHMFSRGVRTFQDIAAIVRTGTVDWAAFASEATRTRAATCCYWTLLLARDLGGAAVPEEVLRALEPRMSSAMRRTITRHLENEIITGHGVCPSIRLRQLMWRAAIRPGRSGHGGNRPWSDTDWNAMLADHLEDGEALPADRMPSSRDMNAWIRYLHSLVSRDRVRPTAA